MTLSLELLHGDLRALREEKHIPILVTHVDYVFTCCQSTRLGARNRLERERERER